MLGLTQHQIGWTTNMHFNIGDLIYIHDTSGWREVTKEKVRDKSYYIERIEDTHVFLEGWDYPIYRHRITVHPDNNSLARTKYSRICIKVRQMQHRRKVNGYAF
jgi:hypothetical protein